METTHEYTRYHTTTVYTTYVIEDRCTFILDVLSNSNIEVHLSCSLSSSDNHTIYSMRSELSPTNQKRPIFKRTQQLDTAALPALTTKTRDRSSRGHRAFHYFHIQGERKLAYFDLTNNTQTPEYSGEDGPS